MSFNTKLDLSKQARIDSGNIFTPSGSISIGEDFFIKNVQIYIDNITSNQTLVYNPILSRLEPATINSNLDGYKILTGINVTQNTTDKTCLDITSGIFLNNGTAYNYTGTTGTTCLSTGDSSFNRYDILYISGTTGATVDFIEGTASSNPIIPTLPDLSVLVAIIEVPSGHTSGGSTNLNIISSSLSISASDVSFTRGNILNVAQALDFNYIYPNVLTFTQNLNEIEYGDSASTITLDWERNKVVQSQDLLGIVDSLTPSQNSVTLTGQTITADTSTSGYTYTLEINDGISSSTKIVKVPFFNKIYNGLFSSDTITSSAITTNLSGVSENNIDINDYEIFVTGNSQYFYLIFPERYGDKPLFLNEKAYNDYTSYTQSFENSFGFSETYRVLRTLNTLDSKEYQFNTKDKTDKFEYVENSEIVNATIESLFSNTFSANTMFSGGTNLLDIFVDTYLTGGTFNNTAQEITFNRSNGDIFKVTGFTPSTDTFVTGGTYTDTAHTLTLIRSNGDNFQIPFSFDEYLSGRFEAGSFTSPTSNGADDGEFISTSGITLNTKDFDPTSSESIYKITKLPRDWDLTATTLYTQITCFVSNTGATSGDGWVNKVSIGLLRDNTNIDTSLSTPVAFPDSFISNNNIHVSNISGITLSGTPQQGDRIIIKIERDVDDTTDYSSQGGNASGDTLPVDVQFFDFILWYKSNGELIKNVI